jgi:outer membrane protein
MRKFSMLAAALLLSAAPFASASADDAKSDGVAGHFQVRLRGLAIVPDASANITVGGVPIGGKTSATTSFQPELDGTYFLTDHIAVEAIAAVTQHSVHNTVAGNIGSVWLLPPTVTAQYHFNPTGAFRPYVGLGVNYTFFFSPKSALPQIHYADNAGFALQAGADIPVGDGPYFINVDAKKLFLSTTVTAAGGLVHANADLNPWILGTGVGIRL